MKAIAVIPARFASTRFPAKLLADRTGRPMIQHVCERVQKAERLARVIVGTDDERIAAAVRAVGVEAVMTRADHASGTDRVAEVAGRVDADIVLNVQGDEPEIDPGSIDRLVALMAEQPECLIATLACPFSAAPAADPDNPAAVKVVFDRSGRALYFSRSRIPYPRNAEAGYGQGPYLHLGIYGYRRQCLLELAKLAPTVLERTEGLEQLRFLENGYNIQVGIVGQASVGIDTPEDYAAFVQRFRGARV